MVSVVSMHWSKNVVNTEWSVWSACRTSCGAADADDQQTRSRQCDNPRPAHGGQDCVGRTTESQPCPDIPCPRTSLSFLLRAYISGSPDTRWLPTSVRPSSVVISRKLSKIDS